MEIFWIMEKIDDLDEVVKATLFGNVAFFMFLRSFVIVLYCPLGLNRSLCQFCAVLLPFSTTCAASLQFVVDSRSMYVHGFRYLIHLYSAFAHSFNSLPVLKTQPCVFTCHCFHPLLISE